MLALFALQESSPSFFERFLPILILLIVVAIVLARLPRVDLGEHGIHLLSEICRRRHRPTVVAEGKLSPDGAALISHLKHVVEGGDQAAFGDEAGGRRPDALQNKHHF